MSTNGGNGNGHGAEPTEAERLDSLVADPGVRFVFHLVNERIKDLADAGIKRSQRTDKLSQDCVTVANKAYGEAHRAREGVARIEAKQLSDSKILVKMAKTMGIESPDSEAPPPMRERFDSLQEEIDLAEVSAAEAKTAAKLAHEAAGDAKALNAEAVTSLKAIAKAVGVGVAALTLLSSSIVGFLEILEKVIGK